MPETTKVVNLNECFNRFDELFCPKIVAELNGQMVKIAKLNGDKVPWHSHDNEDEFFYVVQGNLQILFRDDTFSLNAGDFMVVPKTVEHKVIANGPVKLMLFEPASTAHTGSVESEITQTKLERLDV